MTDPNKCFGCGLCRYVCEPGARQLVPREDVPG
ncbi:MAG: 4Fe-4S binding protein [Promethearchaeota archaeon]